MELSYASILSRLIKKAGLKLTEMSEKALEIDEELTVSYISKLKNGKMRPPSYKVSILIAKILEVEPDELLAATYYESLKYQKIEMIETLMQAYEEKEVTELKEKVNSIVGANGVEIHMDDNENLFVAKGLTITCNKCGEKDDYSIKGINANGVSLICSCNNEENISW